jgi:branched-chain amino acid transport system substrate-binding protein
MKNILNTIAVCFVILTFVSQGFSVENEKIKIGVILPLTGEFGYLGENLRDAALMASEKMKDVPHELIFEDFGPWDLKRVALAAQKLIQHDHVQGIITAFDDAGMVVAPIAKNAKVFHIGIAADRRVEDGEYNFRHYTSPEAMVSVYCDELQKRKITQLGVFVQNAGFTTAYHQALKKALEKTDIKIIDEIIFQPKERDFRLWADRMLKKHPQLFVVFSGPPTLDIICKQLKERGVKDISGCELGINSQDCGLWEGQWFTGGAEPNENFTKQYEEKYKKEPQLGAANIYDSVVFFLKTLQGNPSKAEFSQKLSKVVETSSLFIGAKLEKQGGIFTPAALKKFEKGKVVLEK